MTSWNFFRPWPRGYGYTYDKLNQLLNAKYVAYNDETLNYVLETNRFTEAMNGNILSINRNGKNSWSGQGTYGAMDQLSYTYTGNRLIGVDDAVDDSPRSMTSKITPRWPCRTHDMFGVFPALDKTPNKPRSSL